VTRFAHTLPRPCGRPSPRGEGQTRVTRLRGGKLAQSGLLALTVFLSAACGGKENAVIPGRQDLAQASRGIIPGKTYDNREKIREGMKESDLSAACGAPSEKLESRGDIVSGRWTYLYKDGKIVVQLRDRRVTNVETTFY